MGAWGPGNFENDAALDWLGQDDLAVPGLVRALRSGGDSDACQHGLAAAELVAAWNGHPVAELPEAAVAFVAKRRGAPKPDVIAKARECVAAIAANSELLALWKDDGDVRAWKAVQKDLLDRLDKAPAKRAAPTTSPRAGAVLYVETRIERGLSSGAYRDFRSEGLPVVEPTSTVGVDLAMDFTAEELVRIAGWLRTIPDVAVSLSDISRGRGYKHDPARILPFAGARALHLHLDRARDVTFLESFPDLEELTVHVKCVLELPALPKLRTLVVYAAQLPGRWAHLPALEVLRLPAEAEPTGLDALPALHFLSAGPPDLGALAALPLRRLDLNGVEEDTDLSPLARSKTLEMLSLRVHSPAQVAAVARIPLRRLVIFIPDGAGVDLVEPLRGHPTLQRVSVNGFGWQVLRDAVLAMGFTQGELDHSSTD